MLAIQKSTFGEMEEITEAQARILSTWKSLFPGAATLTDEEAFALAQVGYAQGLDVFNKEIYYLKQEKWNPDSRQKEVKAIGVMPGIRGLRKHARRQIRYEGGRSANFWFEFVRVLDTQEKAEVGAGEHDLVTKAVLRDSVTMGNYLKMRKDIFGNDRSWTDLLKLARADGEAQSAVQKAIEDTASMILGGPPLVTGYGIVKLAELKKDGDKVVRPLQMFSGQNAYYMAEIRAERRALYKRFDLEKQFGAITPDVEDVVEAIDAQVDAEEEISEPTAEAPRSREENLQQLGFN